MAAKTLHKPIKTPQITVLMPVYNAGAFLREAIQSILVQTVPDFEFVIINDGSTDSTPSILAEYEALDTRVLVVHQENRGLVAALNRGIEIARAPYIARMDADDRSLPHRFSRQLEAIEGDSTLFAVGGQIRCIDSVGRPTRQHTWLPVGKHATRIFNHQLRGVPIAHPTAFIRTAALKAIGGYREAFRHAEDSDLWLRASERYEVDNLPVPVLEYRVHPGGVSNIHRHQQGRANLRAQLSYVLRELGLPEEPALVGTLTMDTLFSLLLPPSSQTAVALRLLSLDADAGYDFGNRSLGQRARELCSTVRLRSAYDRELASRLQFRSALDGLRRGNLRMFVSDTASAVLADPFYGLRWAIRRAIRRLRRG